MVINAIALELQSRCDFRKHSNVVKLRAVNTLVHIAVISYRDPWGLYFYARFILLATERNQTN